MNRRTGDAYDQVSDAVALFGFAQEAAVSVSTTPAQSATLAEGIYDVWTDVECFIKVAADATSGLTTSTGYILRTGASLPLYVPAGSKIGAVCASGSGSLRIHRVG